MSTKPRSAIERKIARIPKAEPFSRAKLKGSWSSRSIDRTLAALVDTGKLVRLWRGTYARPKTSKYTGRMVLPGLTEILQFIVSTTGETIQIHGAEAIRRLGLSTQMQVIPSYYTNGRTRKIVFMNAEIRLIHMGRKAMQYAGSHLGTLISAFHYIDAKQISGHELSRILESLNPKELEQLLGANLPLDHKQKIQNWYHSRTKR